MPLGSLSGKGLKTQEMASTFVEGPRGRQGRGAGCQPHSAFVLPELLPLHSLLPLSLPGLPPYSFLTAMCHPLTHPPRLQLSSL